MPCGVDFATSYCEDRQMRLGRLGDVGRAPLLGCLVLLGAVGAATAVGATNANVVVPRNTIIGGRTYAQWEAKAWQWNLANVRFLSSNPPTVPRCTTGGQHGPVWFLHGDNYTGAGNSITRVCHVPGGRYLFLYEPSFECSTVEAPPYHATTDGGLLRCARSFGSVRSTLILDGKRIMPAGIVVETPVFGFKMPAQDNELQVPGATHGRAAAYGKPVMLRPLAKGSHTLVQVSSSHGAPTLSSTFHLTVG